MAESTEYFMRDEDVTQLLHPSGHCTCQGEGECNWCLEHCMECGGTTEQHPVTGDDLKQTFGADWEEQGAEPHDFCSMKEVA
jgi:hypothetical protein